MKIRYFFFIVTVVLASCGGVDEKPVTNDKPIEPKVEVPVFNQDSAYSYIESQVAFGPRVTGTEVSDKCAAWLTAKLSQWMDTVAVQKGKVVAYDNTGLNIKNIIGSYLPGNNNRIFLCSHWDSRPYADYDPDKANHRKPIDGANDGASGVGVLLEIARIISTVKPKIGIDIIFFDAEDYGTPGDLQDQTHKEDTWGLGSQFWAKSLHESGYYARYGILLDMVGAENAQFHQEGFSKYYAPDIVRKVWETARSAGFSDYFVMTEGNPITDDHYYINKIANIPTIDIIHTEPGTRGGFFTHWHTMGDTMDKINKNTLYAVGQSLLHVIYGEK